MAADLGAIYASLELRMNQFEKGLTVAINGLNKLKNEGKEAGEKIETAGTKVNKTGETLGKMGDTLTKRVTVPVTAAATASVKAAIDWESAWTGVTKTVNGTTSQMEKLQSGIRDMSKNMPQSATSIAEVAEAAGQLGIQTDNVISFTKTMIMLGDSTNMSADEAATTLARLANITQMSQNDFDKLGSVIVALGNNFATTEAEISTMALRLAGAGKQIGLTEPQIMAFATALSSVGIEAEAGGSAISKVFVDMQLACETGGEALDSFANAAGVSAQEFKTAFQQDAAGAMISFIKGLQTCEERGVSAIKVLDDMGITETRMRDALLRAAGAGDLFNNTIDVANKAWKENTALTNEANKRYETSASKIQMMKNRIVDAGISIGEKMLPSVLNLVEGIERLVDKFSKLDSGTQETIIKMALFAAGIGPALKATSGLTKGVLGLANGFTKATTFIGAMSKATTAGSGKIAAFGKAVSAASGVKGIGGFVAALKTIAPVAAPAAVAIGTVAAAVKLANTYHEVGQKTVLDTADSYTFLEKVMAKFRGETLYTKEELEKMGLVHKDYSENISKEFQEAVESSSKELAEMKMKLGEINFDNLITQDEKDNFVNSVNDMCQKAIEALEGNKEKTQSLLIELFGADGTISEAEQHNLEIITKSTDEQIAEVNRLKEEVNAILQRKVDEHRELNEQEIQDVSEKMARIKELELVGLAQNQEEILLTKNEFNARVKNLDAKAASELLQEKRKGFDEELIEVQSKYDTAIQMEQKYLETASEEEKQGIIDRINQLEEEKKSTCRQKEDLWEELLEIAENGNAKLKDNINKYTGEILNDDDKMKQRILNNQTEKYEGLNNIAQTGLYDLYNKEKNTYENVFAVVDETTGEIVELWNQQDHEIGAYSTDIENKNKELGRNYFEARDNISQALLSWKNATIDTAGNIIDSDNQICGSLVSVKQNVDGTKTALIDMAGKKYEIVVDSGNAVQSCKEVKQGVDNIPSYKSITVEVKEYKTAVQRLQEFGKDPKSTRPFYANAAGTNNFIGGFTTMHERGYELYNLPGGSKIFNHDASEAAVKEMVTKIFNEGMQKLGNNTNSGGFVLNIENFNNNRKQDIKAIAEELEFYRKQVSRGRGGRY